MTAFADLDIDDEDQLVRFMALRADDPVRNLIERYGYFLARNPTLTQRRFGFIGEIAERGFTVVALEELGLVYSIGLWYSFCYPELMLVSRSSQATSGRMVRVLERIGEALEQETPVPPEETPTVLRSLAQRLGRLAYRSLRAEGLSADELVNASTDFLRAYPYGYGWHFYLQFADVSEVPILMGELK